MKDEIVLNGIILSSGLQGEYDRRLVILTKEQGKITAFARGVRRQNSQMISKTQIFVMGAFTLYPGRNAYTLVNVEAKEYFHELTFDMDRYCYGSYFCEMMTYFAREGERSTDYLNLLFVSLNALKKGLIPVKLVRVIYELKLMDVFGQGLQSFRCPICGNDALTNLFDARAGGILCENCKSRVSTAIPISDQTIYVLQYINGAPFGKLYGFTVSDAVLEELITVVKDFLAIYVDRTFHSAQIIETLS